MPFSLKSLAGLAYAGGFTLWRYRSTGDAVAALGGAGYFNQAAHLVRAGDLLLAAGTDGAVLLAVTAAGAGTVATQVLDGGAGAPVGDIVAAAAGLGFATALMSDLPTLVGLVTHLDASDPLGFGGALPADLAAVDALLPRSGAPKGAVEHETRANRPRFRANFDGAGRRAVEFTAADATSMSMDGFNFPGGFTSSDQSATFAAVLRLKSPTSAAERSVAYVMPRNMTNGTHFPSGLTVAASGNLVFRMRDNFTASTDAVFAWTANTTETLIMVGRHASGPTRNNRLAVRQAGATANVTATGNSTATNYAFNGATPQLPTSARVGSRRYADGNTEENHFDGFLAELAIWNRDLSDPEVADLIAAWRSKWGVA